MTTNINTAFNLKCAGSAVVIFAAVLFGLTGMSGCSGGGGGDSAVSTPTVPPPVSASGITIFAGAVGGGGNADGTPGRFVNPNSLALDSKGNIFVTDTGSCNVRKVVGNVVSTLYADKTCNFSDFQVPVGDPFNAAVSGPADSVYFVNSKGLFKIASDGTVLPDPILVQGFRGAFAFDSAGVLFAVDKAENAVYQIGAGGVRTLIAGGNPVPTEGPSFADGVGAAARFFGPKAIAVGSDGILYVADTDNHVIRKVTRQGVVTTLAGQPNKFGSTDGLGNAAQFFNPSAITVDRSGNVYVAEEGNYTIRKITPAGAVTTLAGAPGTFGAIDGAGAAARFNSIGSIAVNESGVLFVADVINHAIRRVSPEGNVTTIAGVLRSSGAIDATGAAARFSFPSQLAIDVAGNILAVDGENNNVVRKISPSGMVSTLAGNPTSNLFGSVDGNGAKASFSRLAGIAVDKLGNGYATERKTFKVRKITAAGDVTTTKAYSLSGGVIAPGLSSDFTGPSISSIAVDNDGNLYVNLFSDYGGSTSQYLSKITPAGADAVFLCGTDCYPEGVATDNLGNVYVATRNSIRRISSTGTVTYLAGDPSVRRFGSADGVGAAASFGRVEALASDNKGNVFIADTDNHTVRKITAAGVVTTIAGKAGVRGVATGSLPGLLNSPRGIVVDSVGNIFVTTEDAILKIFP